MRILGNKKVNLMSNETISMTRLHTPFPLLHKTHKTFVPIV